MCQECYRVCEEEERQPHFGEGADQHGAHQIDKFASEGASLKDLRIAALCTLGFAGFFRFSELNNILCTLVVFLEDNIKIFVPHSKTDVY